MSWEWASGKKANVKHKGQQWVAQRQLTSKTSGSSSGFSNLHEIYHNVIHLAAFTFTTIFKAKRNVFLTDSVILNLQGKGFIKIVEQIGFYLITVGK